MNGLNKKYFQLNSKRIESLPQTQIFKDIGINIFEFVAKKVFERSDKKQNVKKIKISQNFGIKSRGNWEII